MQISFKGGAELERALKGLGSEIAGRLGQNAVRAGARTIAARARQTAKFIDRSGDLRQSIRIFTDPSERRANASTRTAYIGSRVFYAYWIEFGTKHIAARSFIRNAVDEGADDAFNKLTQNLGQGIEREAAKYRGK